MNRKLTKEPSEQNICDELDTRLKNPEKLTKEKIAKDLWLIKLHMTWNQEKIDKLQNEVLNLQEQQIKQKSNNNIKMFIESFIIAAIIILIVFAAIQ